jgi:outer membrane protein assembly factor BamD (BamD/ComL family)
LSPQLAIPAWAILAAAVLLPAPSPVALAAGSGPAAPAARVAADPGRAVAPEPEPAVDWSDHRLRRAAAEQIAGNHQGVIASLEGIDFSTPPAFAEADRAAFLLAQAYLKLGSVERFATLARAVARWHHTSPYTQWLVYQLHLVEAGAGAPAAPGSGTRSAADTLARGTVSPTGSGVADALAAAILLRDGDGEAALRLITDAGRQDESAALLSYLEALALAAVGRDDESALVRLSTADTVTALGRDLAGIALIRRATRALARDQDARPLLASVPAGSRCAARARHLLGLVTIERGDLEQGRRILETQWMEDSSYAGRREVGLALAGASLDDGRWEAAHHRYRELDRDLAGQREALMRMLEQGSFDALWSSWDRGPMLSEVLILDAAPARRLAERLAAASADLTLRPILDPPAPQSPPATAEPWPVLPPSLEARGAVAIAARRQGESEYDLARALWAGARERERLAELRRYLGLGLERVRGEAKRLQAQATLLDSVRNGMDAVHGRLVAVRDEAKRRLALRSAEVLEAAEQDLRWVAAMRHFHVEGPERERPLPAPTGFPSGDVLTLRERNLALTVRDFVERLQTEGPALVERSFEEAWGPGLIDRAVAQAAEAQRQLQWARSLAAAFDSSLAAASSSDEVRRLAARVAGLERATDSLQTAHRTLRAGMARAAVEGALAGLEAEREAIDYGLAASAYGLAVRLERPMADGSQVVATAARATAPDTAGGTAADQELDDPEVVAWRARAMAALQTFLERHPRSGARGETRFRLADLMLVEARRSFREQMARYVKDQADGGAGRVALPVLRQRSALALYRTMLSEDGDFSQRDAVLFNAGMILVDEADAEAARFFQDLVSDYPGSRYAQEANLKLGDMHFDQKRFAECIPLYQRAAAGGDASLRVIALYKLGWAHFNQERLADAADAFRAVLDVYETEQPAGINVNIAPEAEAYLIHCLARAGGARAFGDYFDRIGPRPYERRVLLAMGQHFRRFGLWAEAVAADELALARFPRHADALISAQRLTETYRRWDRPPLARKAQLEVAFRFAPGSDWFEAQTSDSVRAAGADFARGCWTSVALHHHLEARRTGSAADWRAALDLYRALLSAWPGDGEAPAHRLRAGEASFRLGQHVEALSHYRAAAATGRDSIAEQAVVQQVAVTDAWYESTRLPAPGSRTPRQGAAQAEQLGRDSLARAVLAAGDELIARYPQHRAAGDVAWRQGQLAFAHGWFDRAARDFEGMMVRHPGDPRAATAAALRGDALFRARDYEGAGAAFEVALQVARRAGRDSLERRAAQSIPVCYFRHAEAVAAADSASPARWAPLFEKVATGWPEYEHAHAAQYRAALAWLRAGTPREGIRALQALIRTFPRSEYVKDAYLQIPRAWESMDEKEKAADAYVAFADGYPEDESAAEAWLKAADLQAAAGRIDHADTLRLAYIARHPGDVETAMEILEGLARRDLAGVGPERPISSLLERPERSHPAARAGRGNKSRPAAAPQVPPTPPGKPPSQLAAYLHMADAHPKLASQSVLAQVRFLEGEEIRAAYAAARLRQPIETSVVAKQSLLDSLVARYRASVDLGVAEWAHASAFRIGEALVAFGEALEQSERPADLSGDDLRAYEDVLLEQSAAFHDRGEGVWTELLRQQGGEGTGDAWVARARDSLWKRLGSRFFFRPEVEFPLIEESVPISKGAGRSRDSRAGASTDPSIGAPERAPDYAQREGEQR